MQDEHVFPAQARLSSDGSEVLRRLRAAGSRVPVVISSGYLDVAVERRLPCGEFQGFLAKPYGATELVNAIERARGGTTTSADTGRLFPET